VGDRRLGRADPDQRLGRCLDSTPSVYAVPRTRADVARRSASRATHRLRLAVKGGGHSYQGTSNAPTRCWSGRARWIASSCMTPSWPQGCDGAAAGGVARRRRGLGACLRAGQQGGGYVQGGGCLTVGVAGLIQSGGFGSFSKRYGLAAASLLEAEVVTADGAVRIANAHQPELFWA
jgi:FAD/FMN-containing dehydrogenase